VAHNHNEANSADLVGCGELCNLTRRTFTTIVDSHRILLDFSPWIYGTLYLCIFQEMKPMETLIRLLLAFVLGGPTNATQT
jgi:hypothetical protein